MTTMTTIEALFSDLMTGDTQAALVLEDAVEAGVTGAPKGAIVVCVTKSDDRYNPSMFAVVTPKKSIRIVGVRRTIEGPIGYDKTFKLGDLAEYKSWNISYYGAIVGIGPKTVTIDHGHDRGTSRLTLDAFSWRNRDFDAEEKAASNSETMNYI